MGEPGEADKGSAEGDSLGDIERVLERSRQKVLSGVAMWDRDVEHRMHEQASAASAAYALEKMLLATPVRPRKYPNNGHYELLEGALPLARPDGFHAEFGVYKGESLGFIASLIDKVVYGFDSFEGLPEAWSWQLGRGSFDLKGEVPQMAVPLRNFRIVKGAFKDQIPAFLAQVAGPAGFLHLDCYTYQSTREALFGLAERITAGTVIVLRQYFNFPGWERQQFRAFQDFVAESGKAYRYLAFTPTGSSVAVVIL